MANSQVLLLMVHNLGCPLERSWEPLKKYCPMPFQTSKSAAGTGTQTWVAVRGLAGLFFDCAGSSQLRELLSCSDARASHCSDFSCWGAQVLGCVDFSGCGSWAVEHRLRSCGTWAQLLCGMWDLPRSRIKPMSPALAGGFLTIGPPGKSTWVFFICGQVWESLL